MIRLIQQRVKAGVDVRIIGKVAKRGGDLRAQKMPGASARARHGPRRRHGVRGQPEPPAPWSSTAVARWDSSCKDPKVVKRIADVFEADWAKTELGQKELKAGEKAEKLKAGEKVQQAQELANLSFGMPQSEARISRNPPV